MFHVLDQDGVGSLHVPGRYARFSRSRRHDTLRPPGIGEHTAEVLAEVGISSADIDGLAATGAVHLGTPMVFRSMSSYR
jgi:crotonobetainyl-CoA:carnitine CoA-transferase CaiB-like acyl-CoA transferase